MNVASLRRSTLCKLNRCCVTLKEEKRRPFYACLYYIRSTMSSIYAYAYLTSLFLVASCQWWWYFYAVTPQDVVLTTSLHCWRKHLPLLSSVSPNQEVRYSLFFPIQFFICHLGLISITFVVKSILSRAVATISQKRIHVKYLIHHSSSCNSARASRSCVTTTMETGTRCRNLILSLRK